MTRTFVSPRRWSALLLATTFGLVQACSSDDDTGPAKTISVTLNPTSASVVQGASTNVTVTVTGTGGFTAVPAINVTGLPTGTTVAVSNIQTTGSTTTATVALTVGATTAPGTYPITATATATGVTTVTATFTLTVTAAPTPSFVLTLAPTTLSVAQGASGTSTVNIARTNLTGAIALAVTGAPTGVTATLNPASATGTSSTLTVAAASNATVGAATLTITGTATGATNQTVTLPITITATTPGVALTSTPAALSVAQGATGNTTINVARTNFTGDLTLAATNLPTGVTAAFVPNPNTGTGTASTLTFTVGAVVVPGTTTVTVTGTGTGITAATTTVALTVTAATPGVTLTLTPATLSVAQSASAVTTVNIARTNFTGNPTLTVENLPTGVTAAFVPNPPTGTASSLTLTASATATIGTSTVTIRGTGTGIADATVPLPLTVTAAGGGGSYTLSATPATVSATVGGAAAASTINITRTGGFAGSVALAVTGAPTGVTATLTPTSTTGNTSALSITAAAGATIGAATLTITGTATGLTNQTTTVALTVAAAGGGNFTLSAAPAAVSVTQGGAAATSTVNITRTGGFTGDVALAVTGAPTGVTATLNPTTSTGTGATSTLTITAAAGATVGAATLTVTGTSAGLTNQTATVALTVAATGGSGNVTVDFSQCAAANKPIWLAFQNGTSGWTQGTNVGDVYKFNVTQGKGGIAFATTSTGGGTAVTVLYYTQAELTGGTINNCGTTVGGKTITGTVAGLGAGETGTISLGNASATAAANGSFTLNGVLTGNQDLVAYRSNFLSPGTADRVIIRRDQNIAAGGTVGTVDFGAAEAVAPLAATGTATNAGSDMVTSIMQYFTGASCAGATLGINLSTTATFTMRGVPAAQQRASDYHVLSINAVNAAGTSFRTALLSFHTMADKSFTLGASLPAPTVTALAAAYKRLQAVVTLPAEYNTSMLLTYQGGTRGASVVATSGWLGTGASTLAFPDFAGVAGWQDVWVPATGTTVNWTVAGTGSNVTTTGFCTEGATLKSAFVSGSL